MLLVGIFEVHRAESRGDVASTLRAMKGSAGRLFASRSRFAASVSRGGTCIPDERACEATQRGERDDSGGEEASSTGESRSYIKFILTWRLYSIYTEACNQT